MVNLLNDTTYNVESKHKGFEPFLAKYVVLTSRKSPYEAYNFGQQGSEEFVQRDWPQFERRLDYIVEFKGK
jgi:hypothetical protein